ncbi:two-partner secretion domain-containing protein, partial [Hylemonella gracilis]
MAHLNLNMHKGKIMQQGLKQDRHMDRRNEAGQDRRLGFTAAQRKRIAAGVLLSYLCYPGVVLAQAAGVEAAANSPHAPQITQSQNNTTVVNINQASKDGVSRNQYNQFNVGPKGLILNNSTAITQTQLAGYIDGNAALKGQAARIILNEVTSANPSALRGYTEIAGQRAEFILANPNGISCNGCGFINTSRSTLTTGTAQFGANGGLTGFRVDGGQIAIEGQGLNASNVDQLDLLSRTIRINGQLWAQQLNLVTGRNVVDHATLAATPLAGGDSNTTGVALDVAAIGGMYANVIRIVGTEKGFGVNSQGQMIADKDFTLAADGRITHSGLVQATQGQLTIQTRDVLDNTGTVSGKNVNVSADAIQNAASAVLAAEQRLDLSAARQLDNAGQVQAANARIQAETLRNAQTGLIATSQQLDITSSQALSNAGRVQAGNANINAASVDNAANAVLLAQQALAITTAQQFANAGRVQAGSATVTAGQFNNAASGTVAGDQALSISSAGTLVNEGQIAAVQNLSLSATGALTLAGTTQANEGTLTLHTDAALDNTGTTGGRNVVATAASVHNSSAATLLAEDTLSLTTAGALNNEGNVQANNANITAGSISNAANALVYADRDLQINSAGAVSNQGAVTASQNLSLTAQGDINQNGLMQAIDGQLTVQGHQALNNTGLIGGRNASLSAVTLTNSANAVLLADEQLNLTATGLLTNAGGVQATDITVTAGSVSNTKDGLMFAEGALQLTTGGTLENKGALVAQDMTLQARNLNNTSGAVLLALGDADIRVTETLRNASATIEAEGNLRIEAGTLRNEREVFEVSAVVTVRQYNDIELDVTDDYRSGLRSYTETVTNHVVAVDSPQGRILSGGDMTLNVHDTLDNVYSTISAGNDLFVKAKSPRNQDYTVDNTTVHDGQDILTGFLRVCGRDGANDNFFWCTPQYTFDYDKTSKTTVRLASSTFSANRNLTGEFVELKNGSPVDALAQSQAAAHQGPDRDATLPDLILGQDGYQLPSSALVKPSNSPNHPYLVETDPRLTSYKTFISSDYILDKLDYDFAETPKRLGDGFVEQRLVRDQLLSQTGFQYLDGYDNLEKQYVGLMENALEQTQALSLSPGVALTPQQIAQLQEPIVWMVLESFETAFGVQTALVPKVYLGHNDNIVLRSDGSLLASGGSMSLNVAGGLSNSGTIQSGDALSIETGGDLYNLSGAITAQGGLGLKVGGDLVVETVVDALLVGQQATISGGSVSMDVAGDARFTGASLEAEEGLSVQVGGDLRSENTSFNAGGDMTLAAQGNVMLVAVAQTTQTSSGGRTTTETEHLTNQLQAGGNLTIKAGGNLLSEGTSFQADGDMALSARGNVTLAAVTNESQTLGRRYEQSSTTVVGNELDAGGNLSIRSGGDLVSTASTVQAGDTLSLAADGDVLLLAATERDYSYEKTTSTSGGTFNKKKTTKTSTEETLSNVGNTLSGENIQIQSGGLLHIHASTLDAEQDITLQAENIALTAGIDQEYERDTKVTKSTFKVKSQDKGSMEQTAVATELNAANIKVLATGNVQITASNLNAEETLAIGDVAVQQQADGSFVAVNGEGTPENLIVDTLALKSESWNEKSEGYRGVAADLMKGFAVAAGALAQTLDMKAPEIKLGESSSQKTTTVTQQSSTLNAGEQLVLAAQNNVMLIGAEVSTEGTAILSAANVTLEAAAETSTSETSHSEHTIGGVGGKLNKDEVSLGGMKEVKTTETTTTTSTTHKGTTLNVGNLAVLATQDVNIVASKVDVDGQAIVQAGGSVNITGKQDTTSTETRKEVETTTTTVGVRNAYMDTAMAVKAAKEAVEAAAKAEEAYDEAKKRVDSGELAKAALKDYETNRNMAVAAATQAPMA